MNISEMTCNYYSHWVGENITGLSNGMHFIYNPDRDNTPKGYPEPMDVYVFLMNDRVIMSYGNRAKEKIEHSRDKINEASTIGHLKPFLENMFSVGVRCNIKYIYKNSVDCQIKAEILRPNQCELFLEFFKGNNPNSENYSWVKNIIWT
jgi:hypothetical protein